MTLTKSKAAVDGIDGDAGVSATSSFITNDSHIVPADKFGGNLDLSGAVTENVRSHR